MTVWKTFLTVTATALVVLCLGGAFGFAAGKLTPEFFRRFTPWNELEPVGFATAGGAVVGVLLGGGLGCFGVLTQFLSEWRKRA